MELTEKCKEDFEAWYLKTIEIKIGNIELLSKTVKFYLLPPSMQYGVYVDFFDSVGIYIEASHLNTTGKYGVGISDKDGYLLTIKTETRHEARQKAIEKANEIYNSQ